MGYRSDVRIITTRKGFDELKKYTDKYLKEKKWKYGNLLDYCHFFYKNNNSVYFGWNGIKWYRSSDYYEDVNAIMDGLNDLSFKDLSYRYARIGEDYCDYTEDSYESTNEEEQYLEYPSYLRCFDDEWTVENLKKYERNTEEGMEL